MAGPMLVTLTQAKDNLKVDESYGDANLALLVRGASVAVLRYLKTPDAYQDSAGDIVEDLVPEDVQLAVLMLVGQQLRDPDGVEGKDWDDGYLPRPVKSLLYPLRDPTLA